MTDELAEMNLTFGAGGGSRVAEDGEQCRLLFVTLSTGNKED